MRTIRFGARFKKDFKRESRGFYAKSLVADLRTTTDILCADEALSARYQDHSLAGRWVGYRDCHIKPDLVLIYRKLDDQWLELARLGSHSELSL
jgi:mRNA interferase YafQ